MNSADLTAWLEQRRVACGMRFTQIPWRDCTHWAFKDGALVHDSGAFFSIVGVRARSTVAALDNLALPLIDQPEIGILGFLLRPSEHGYEWMLQAKAEPGSVGFAQLAPTVQATKSNFSQVHGGAPTPFLDLFRDEGRCVGAVIDVRQSEQGSMFLNKYNRNVAIVSEGATPPRDQWRWFGADALRALLHEDFAVNTDARSVLAATPWRFISATGTPFTQASDAWTRALASSYAEADPKRALIVLEAVRAATELHVEKLPLEALPACKIDEREILSLAREPALAIGAYSVDAADREVKHWRQPLVSRTGDQDAVLVCARRDGVLRFFLRLCSEIGFTGRAVQFGPSLQSDSFGVSASWLVRAFSEPSTIIRCSTRQSDEGGRFMQSVMRYRIAEITEPLAREDEAGVWVTLGDLEQLSQISGALTNEARTAVSLLLRWA